MWRENWFFFVASLYIKEILHISFLLHFNVFLSTSFRISTLLLTTGGIHTYNSAHKVYSQAHTTQRVWDSRENALKQFVLRCTSMFIHRYMKQKRTLEKFSYHVTSRKGGRKNKLGNFPFMRFTYISRSSVEAWSNEKIMRWSGIEIAWWWGDVGAIYIKLWIRNFSLNIKYVTNASQWENFIEKFLLNFCAKNFFWYKLILNVVSRNLTFLKIPTGK